MRLLNTSTLTLDEFYGAVPKYAILSHRWEKEEVSFQAMNAGRAGRANQLMGYEKIKRSCFQAMDDGLRYIWVDTCCIDKTSSAELSEAINSMFLWYRNAEVCYAYLSDVDEDSELSESLWFTRGWTLQELLAPSKVVFYGHGWTLLGTRESLNIRLSDITGISSLDNFQNASIAQKMSWASRRVTTRVEDIAYCLLGLFGVYMPPLYGEGKNAFLRLQLEILSKSDDESIFAWTEDLPESGMLASSPASFCDSGDVVQMGVGGIKRVPYYMTNQGLRVKGNVFAISVVNRRFQLPINCRRKFSMAVTLVHSHGDQYYRLPRILTSTAAKSANLSTSTPARVLYIRQRDSEIPYLADGVPGQYEFLIKKYFSAENFKKHSTRPLGVFTSWGSNCQLKRGGRDGFDEDAVLSINISALLPGCWATIIYQTHYCSLFGTIIYFDEKFRVGIHVLDHTDSVTHEQMSIEELMEELQHPNLVRVSEDLEEPVTDRTPNTRAGSGRLSIERIDKSLQRQDKRENLGDKLYPVVDDTFRRLLVEQSPPLQLSHTINLSTLTSVLTVKATLKHGPHLGKQRFEVNVEVS